MKFLMLFIISCLIISDFFTQSISNVDFRAEGKTILISYDFKHNKLDTIFNLEITFKSDKGEIIIPKIISGEIRNVTPGNNKKIYWDILSEGISLSGRYLVELRELKKYKTIKIGNQVWLAENLYTDRFRNGDFIPEAKSTDDWKKAENNKEPAWCYYNNDPSTEVKFGKLYNWYALNDPRGIAPHGWNVPMNADWIQLYSYLGDGKIANDKLKAKFGWGSLDGKSTNGSDASGFSAVPNGYRKGNGEFLQSNSISASFWSTEKDENEYGYTYVHCLEGEFTTTDKFTESIVNKGDGYPIRFVKDTTVYNQVNIGGKIWMKENLNVARFRNGDPIPQATSAEDWKRAAKNKQPAWCYYENDPKNGFKYGIIYNGFAVNDTRGLAPKGWHVSNNDEWKILESNCGGNISGRILTVEEYDIIKKNIGIYLKSNSSWTAYYEYYRGEISGNGIDSFGFCGLPGGSRLPEKYSEYDYPNVSSLLFQGIGGQGVWWSSTQKGYNNSYCYILASKLGFNIWEISHGWGASVRCVKD